MSKSEKVSNISQLNSAVSLDNDNVIDPVSHEYKARNEAATELFRKYVEVCEKKVKEIPFFRYSLLLTSLIIILGFAVVLCILACRIIKTGTDLQATQFGAFAAVAVSIVSSIIGIITLITKYFFPLDENKVIVEVVKAIQENDFKNKQFEAEEKKQADYRSTVLYSKTTPLN